MLFVECFKLFGALPVVPFDLHSPRVENFSLEGMKDEGTSCEILKVKKYALETLF